MADFPNVVITNGTGVTLESNICIVNIAAGASNDAGVNYVYDFIDITPGASYSFAVDVERQAGTTPARLDVKWRNPDGSSLSVVQGPAVVSTVGGKSTLTYTGVAPAGAGHAIVCVRLTSAPSSAVRLVTSNPGVTANPNQPAPATLTAVAVAGDRQVTVSWTPSNASAFSGYTVQADKGNTTPYTVGASVRSQVVTGLANGVQHTFTVTGKDAAGVPKADAAASATPVAAASTGGLAGLTLPARGWFSGGSGATIDMNTDKSFGAWRGSPVDFLAHWADAYNGTVWDLPGIEGSNGPAYRFKGLLDLAMGGPENGFTNGSTNNRFPTVAAGADDAKFEAMLVKLKGLRTIDGVLYPTILRPFHELDGNWFRWSVRSSNLTDFGNIMKQWRAIQKRVYPEAIWALCFNGDSYNTDVTPAQMWTAAGGADITGSDRYNQYPTIGTNRAGGFTSWASGSTSGTVDRPVGAEKWRQFAAARGVPLYFPEYANNGYDTGTPSNASDDPYWVQQWFAWVAANAGKGAGNVLAEGWFNVTGKEEERWPVYRTDGGVIRHPNVATAYRNAV